MQDLFSSSDLKTLAQFLVLNYAADFFVLGGAVYAYNKARQFVQKRWGVGHKKLADMEKEVTKLMEETIKGDEESAKKLVELISQKVEQKMARELGTILDSMLKDISQDLKLLRNALVEQDNATHRMIESLDGTINRAQNYARMWKEGSQEARDEAQKLTEGANMSMDSGKEGEAEDGEGEKQETAKREKKKENEPVAIKVINKMWSTNRSPSPF